MPLFYLASSYRVSIFGPLTPFVKKAAFSKENHRLGFLLADTIDGPTVYPTVPAVSASKK
jgi:hypothetical protein